MDRWQTSLGLAGVMNTSDVIVGEMLVVSDVETEVEHCPDTQYLKGV